MSEKQSQNKILSLLLLGMIILFFQNCSESFSVNIEGLSDENQQQGSTVTLPSETMNDSVDADAVEIKETAGLSVATYISKFIVPISVPACDKNDPQVQFIDSAADWGLINNKNKSVFCISPGDYSSVGTISITESGFSAKRRYIVLDNGPHADFDDTSRNPANQPAIMHAIVKQLRIRANYWVIDRIVQRGADIGGGWVIGDYNIFNNMLMEKAPKWQIIFYAGSDYNTVQHSVCRSQSENIDTLCLGITDAAYNKTLPPNGEWHNLGNRFVSNEIYDYADGIQLVHSPYANPGVGHQDMSGTIIDDNDIYQTGVKYVNAAGQPDPNGDYSCSENGIDMKVGGSGSSLDKRVTVSNNRVWGMRKSKCPGMSDAGGAIINPNTGLNSYIHVLENIVWDNARGMMLGTRDNTGFVVKNNIITESHPSAESPQEFGLSSPSASVGPSMIIHNNVISGYSYSVGAEENKDYQCNFIKDTDSAAKRNSPTGSRNMYFVDDYRLNRISESSVGDVYGKTSEAQFKQGCFQIKQITDPQIHCLKEVMPTQSTPKADGCAVKLSVLLDQE